MKLVQLYCQFPFLEGAKVGLVDLPGLGEIGNSASDVHLKGLEDKVDQIFLVMRPTAAKAFTDAEVAHNLDQLQVIQPAVRRGDLILVGINKDKEAGQNAADNLRAHFTAEINAGRDDRYEIIDYCAVDDDDVACVLETLLERLGTRLPEMDRQKVQACMNSIDLTRQIPELAERLIRSMDRVLRAIPSSDRVMKQRIDTIERAVIGELNLYAVELTEAVATNSEVFEAFVASAKGIHDRVSERIEDGLFRINEDEWLELTSSSKDFYNLYRDEDKRIRYEIIDAYCVLDRFYGEHVDNFKTRVLDIVLHACGMDTFFNFIEEVPVDELISKVKSELGASLRDEDLDKALTLLKQVKFDFRSNMFLQIESHLAELANPSEIYYGYSKPVNKRNILGGDETALNKQERLHEFLCRDASTANDAILAELTNGKDYFNKYLATSIDFFNNYLFGKDEDNFKQVVIRGLIREYKEYVLPDADDASQSPAGHVARAIKDSVRELQGEKSPTVHAVAPSEARESEVKQGTVVKVTDAGAVICYDKNETGFAFYKNIPRAKHGKIGLQEGQKVNLKVLGQDDKGRTSLAVVA